MLLPNPPPPPAAGERDPRPQEAHRKSWLFLPAPHAVATLLADDGLDGRAWTESVSETSRASGGVVLAGWWADRRLC